MYYQVAARQTVPRRAGGGLGSPLPQLMKSQFVENTDDCGKDALGVFRHPVET
jgi:hypothetical protein